jgi:transcriptional regulator of acetoin/glycerol metabolism
LNNIIEYINPLVEWEKFKKAVSTNPSFRPITLQSWNKCKQNNLKPDSLDFKFLSDIDFNNKKEKNQLLICAADPYMDSMSASLIGIPHMVALSDKDGWIISNRGNPDELGGKNAGLCNGSSWAEEHIGNNGIGTALVLGQPVFIYGVEHFGMIYGSCACIGVPIFENKEIIGAIDISVPVEYAVPSRLHIIVACACSIEATISKNRVKTKTNKVQDATMGLLTMVVHDLKNPLSMIKCLGEIGELTPDKEKMCTIFNRIVKHADEINSIAMQLFDVLKPVELETQKIKPLLKEVVNLYQFECILKKIELSLVNEADVYIKANANLFKRAITNILINAIQNIKEDGAIIIKTELTEDFLLISIKDSADGIPNEIQKDLFSPYVSSRPGGTGLGLYMVNYTINIIHNGKTWICSKKGEGTVFYIKMPVVVASKKMGAS